MTKLVGFIGLCVTVSVISLNAMATTSVVTTPTLCDAYKQTNDANYKEGVDVNGNAVTPADLPSSSSVSLPDTVEIPLTIDLADRLNLSTSGIEMKSPMGTIKVHKDGKVFFNDKDITNDAKTYCANAHNGSMSGSDMIPIDIGPPPSPPMADGMGTTSGPSSPVPATVSPSVTTSP